MSEPIWQNPKDMRVYRIITENGDTYDWQALEADLRDLTGWRPMGQDNVEIFQDMIKQHQTIRNVCGSLLLITRVGV